MKMLPLVYLECKIFGTGTMYPYMHRRCFAGKLILAEIPTFHHNTTNAAQKNTYNVMVFDIDFPSRCCS